MSSRLNPDPDIETLYSPSRWSKRYTSEEVLKKHVEYITERKLITFIFNKDMYLTSGGAFILVAEFPVIFKIYV